MWETRVQSLGREDPLEKEMVTHSSILAWRIPWTEEPGGLQSTESQRVGHDWATSLHFIPFATVMRRTDKGTFLIMLNICCLWTFSTFPGFTALIEVATFLWAPFPVGNSCSLQVESNAAQDTFVCVGVSTSSLLVLARSMSCMWITLCLARPGRHCYYRNTRHKGL